MSLNISEITSDLEYILDNVDIKTQSKEYNQSTTGLIKNYPKLRFLEKIDGVHTDICRGLVEKDYVESSIENFNHIIVTSVHNVVLGFSLLEEKLISPVRRNMLPQNALYLSLVCSKKMNEYGPSTGSFLIGAIDTLALSRNIKTIYLHAANTDLVKFYIKKGYVVGEPGKINVGNYSKTLQIQSNFKDIPEHILNPNMFHREGSRGIFDGYTMTKILGL